MDTGTVIWQLLLQVVLILINAFFASTEIAVISLSASKLKKMADEGDKKAGRMLQMVEEPAGFLSTIQIGITLAGFLASAFAAENFSGPIVSWLIGLGVTIPHATLNTITVILITIVLSYFTLVFGELVPKRVAMQKPFAVAKFATGVISGIALVMRPVISLLSASTNGVLRLLRMKTQAEEESVTPEEIRMMVELGHQKGTIDAEEKEMLENVFEFGDAMAKDVMTHRSDIVAINIGAHEDEIIELIEQSGLSRFPVYEDKFDNIVGVLSARQYLLNAREDEPLPLKQLLRPAYFVPETVDADILLRDMQGQKIHLSVVVDEYGTVCGVVTMEDLIEEIVGNIYDEFDAPEEPELLQISDNLWRVAGEMDIEQLAEETGITLPQEREYDTLSGLVFNQLSSIPADGSSLEVDACGLHIAVEAIADKRVEWALVSVIGETQVQQNPAL